MLCPWAVIRINWVSILGHRFMGSKVNAFSASSISHTDLFIQSFTGFRFRGSLCGNSKDCDLCFDWIEKESQGNFKCKSSDQLSIIDHSDASSIDRRPCGGWDRKISQAVCILMGKKHFSLNFHPVSLMQLIVLWICSISSFRGLCRASQAREIDRLARLISP